MIPRLYALNRPWAPFAEVVPWVGLGHVVDRHGVRAEPGRRFSLTPWGALDDAYITQQVLPLAKGMALRSFTGWRWEDLKGGKPEGQGQYCKEGPFISHKHLSGKGAPAVSTLVHSPFLQFLNISRILGCLNLIVVALMEKTFHF